MSDTKVFRTECPAFTSERNAPKSWKCTLYKGSKVKEKENQGLFSLIDGCCLLSSHVLLHYRNLLGIYCVIE